MRSEAVWESVAPGLELATLEGHTGRVADLCPAATAAGTVLVSAGGDGTLRVWDPAARREPRVLRGHADAVDTVCVVGGLLVSAGRDRTVRTWDLATGEQRSVLTGHRGAVPVEAGGETLVASVLGESVRLWDPGTAATRQVLPGAIGRTIACGGELVMGPIADGSLGQWDLTTGELHRTVRPDAHTTVGLCSLTAGGRPLIAGAGYDQEMEGGRITVWDPATGEVVRVIEHEPLVAATLDRVVGLRAVRLGGRERLVSVGHRTVRIWDAETGAPLQVFIPPESWVVRVCFFRAGGRELLAVPERYVDSLCVWDTTTGELVNRVQYGRGSTEALCSFELEGRTLLAGADGHSRTVRLWDPLGPGTRPRPTGHTGEVYGVWALRDKAVSVSRESLRIWDPRTGAQLRRIKGRLFGIRDVHAFTANGAELLAGAFLSYDDGRVRIWDPAAGRQLRRLERRWDEGPAVVCSFGRDGRVLLAAAHDDRLRIWDPVTGELRHEESFGGNLDWLGRITVHGRPALIANERGDGPRIWYPHDNSWQHLAGPDAEFAFMLDGRPFVAAERSPAVQNSAATGHAWTLRIWDPLTGEERCVLRGDAGTRFAGVDALTLDGRPLLVTHGAEDRTVRVWDPTTGRCEHAISIHHEVVGCAPLGDGMLATAVPSGLIAHRIRP